MVKIYFCTDLYTKLPCSDPTPLPSPPRPPPPHSPPQLLRQCFLEETVVKIQADLVRMQELSLMSCGVLRGSSLSWSVERGTERLPRENPSPRRRRAPQPLLLLPFPSLPPTVMKGPCWAGTWASWVFATPLCGHTVAQAVILSIYLDAKPHSLEHCNPTRTLFPIKTWQPSQPAAQEPFFTLSF